METADSQHLGTYYSRPSSLARRPPQVGPLELVGGVDAVGTYLLYLLHKVP